MQAWRAVTLLVYRAPGGKAFQYMDVENLKMLHPSPQLTSFSRLTRIPACTFPDHVVNYRQSYSSSSIAFIVSSRGGWACFGVSSLES